MYNLCVCVCVCSFIEDQENYKLCNVEIMYVDHNAVQVIVVTWRGVIYGIHVHVW